MEYKILNKGDCGCNHLDDNNKSHVLYCAIKKPPKDDILEVAIEQTREKFMKRIEVDNCQDCLLVEQDRDGYYIGCRVSDLYSKSIELPKDKVHDKCPLKDNNYKIKLK